MQKEFDKMDFYRALLAVVEKYSILLDSEVLGSEMIHCATVFLLERERLPGMAILTAHTAIGNAVKDFNNK